ncbi:MAG TPA: DUF5686 family protein [Gillisia sp.]|nr:DUF5686 family protein [Gillisia sp.]
MKILLCCLFTSILAFGQKTIPFHENSASGAFSDTTAIRIIKNTIDNIPHNSPKIALPAFQYKSYSKTVIKREDTTTHFIEPSVNNYIFEKLSLHQFSQKKTKKETVIASNMPGFYEPVYDVFEKSLHSNSIYEKEYDIFNKKFFGPLSEDGLEHYKFQLTETVTDTLNPYYVILFSSKDNSEATQLQGELHINTKSFAVQEATVNHRMNINAKITHHYNFFEEDSIWFPSETKIEANLINNIEPINLFGKNIPLGKVTVDREENINSSLTQTSSNFDIRLKNIPEIEGKNIDIEALITENNPTEVFWEQYRKQSLDSTEYQLMAYADSIARRKNIRGKLERNANFNNGYYRIGFFDFDLKYLVKYNDYEGFRLGVGGFTNYKFSQYFKLGGYIARGFKDHETKYKIGVNFLIAESTNSILGFNYTKDIQEVGSNLYLTDSRTYSLFEPRLVNITQFYKYNSWQTSLQHQVSPKVQSELQLSRSEIEQTSAYAFRNNGMLFSNYTLSEAKISVLWTPFSKLIKTPYAISEFEPGFPKISAQITQSFKGVFDGNFNYTKFDLKLVYEQEYINKSLTEVVLEGNLGLGNIPLTHLYHAYPNSPNKETIMQRFSVAGIRSFETMFFNEFFSDKLASIQIKHHLKPFVISERIQPEFVLITRHAIGDISNVEKHQNITFSSLKEGYSESGFEINKILFGFGLSFAYRYGAYHLPTFEENLSFKFTFNMKI